MAVWFKPKNRKVNLVYIIIFSALTLGSNSLGPVESRSSLADEA